jgi:hypothetical protein
VKKPNPAPYRWNPQHAASVLAAYGLTPRDAPAHANAKALVVARVGADTASSDTAGALHARSGGCVFYLRDGDRVTGLFGFIPLKPEGLAALQADRFDGVRPPLNWVSEPQDPLAVIYGWVFVGSTARSAAAVVAGAMALREQLPAISWYARAATDDGLRFLTRRMGYAPLAASATGLLCSAPFDKELEVAA